MSRFCLISAYTHAMTIKVDSEVFENEGDLECHLKSILDEHDVELLLHDGELELPDTEEVVVYKIQIV